MASKTTKAELEAKIDDLEGDVANLRQDTLDTEVRGYELEIAAFGRAAEAIEAGLCEIKRIIYEQLDLDVFDADWMLAGDAVHDAIERVYGWQGEAEQRRDEAEDIAMANMHED